MNIFSGLTVNLFNFVSDLFLRYSRGGNFHEHKSPQNLYITINTNEMTKGNGKN